MSFVTSSYIFFLKIFLVQRIFSQKLNPGENFRNLRYFPEGEYIRLAATDSVKLICHAREVFPGRGFSSGVSVAKKWGLEIFWGKCLKIRRLSDFFAWNCLPRGT